MKVLVPLAPGFEEIEAITIIDVLRRAEIDITTLFLEKNPVPGSHDISILGDADIDEINPEDYNFIILPGGMPGSINLNNDKRVINLIQNIYDREGYIAAICAAPLVFGEAGLLKEKNATCYPGFEERLLGAKYLNEPVVVHDNIITGKGAGCSLDFALKIVEIISGKEKALTLRKNMMIYW
jgi:protein deglycase